MVAADLQHQQSSSLKNQNDEIHRNFFDFKSINLDKNNFGSDETKKLLLDSITNCEYVALDCEFLISRFQTYKNKPTKELYEDNLELWKSASLVQVGLTFFKVEHDETLADKINFDSISFSIIVIPDYENNNDVSWSVEVRCMAFLYEHNFDFKNYFKNAIPYQSHETQPTIKSEKTDEFSLKDIFKLIHEKKKPLIVHRGFTDILFIYSCFVDVLPSTYEEYKEEVLRFFSKVYDTKLLTMNIENNNLGNCYTNLAEKFASKVNANLLLDYSSPEGELKPHDASYDSFMTAMVFTLKKEFSSNKFDLQKYENIVRSTNGDSYCALANKKDIESQQFYDDLDQFE